jgi:DNA-binding IclR family transcriptional regulator
VSRALSAHRRDEPAPKDDAEAKRGVQSVRRAAQLLLAVARGPADGMRLSDLAAATGLDRATTHRLLATLKDEKLIEHGDDSKRYLLGLEFFALAAAASNRYDVSEIAHDALHRLAEQTGDSAFFCLRSGNDYLCVDVQTGAFPIKTLPMDIGSRSPLGADATGIAYLALLPEVEVDQILAANRRKLAILPAQDELAIRARIAACRAKGYAVSPAHGRTQMASVAVALPNRRGRPISSITLASIGDRLNGARVAEAAALLQVEMRRIVEMMLRMPDQHRHRHSWDRHRRR